jgi:uncharacterized protein DUF4136
MKSERRKIVGEKMNLKLKGSINRLLLLLAVALLASAAVSAQDVKYNFMPGTDFSKYHTYKWVDLPENVHPNQIISQEIKQAVDNTLATKGLTQATGDTADVYVGYQCSIDQERQLNAWGMRGIGGGMGGLTTSTISNGTLAVDFYDPTSKNLIWRGTATKTLNPSGNQQKDMEKLNKSVAKLLKNFPPPPAK